MLNLLVKITVIASVLVTILYIVLHDLFYLIYSFTASLTLIPTAQSYEYKSYRPWINNIPRLAKYFVFLENRTFCCPVWALGIALAHILTHLTQPAGLASLNSGTTVVLARYCTAVVSQVRFYRRRVGYLPFPLLLYYLSMVNPQSVVHQCPTTGKEQHYSTVQGAVAAFSEIIWTTVENES